MKKIFSIIFILSITIFLLWNCGGGPSPIDIEGLDHYADPNSKYELSYPKNWNVSVKGAERLYVISHKEAVDRFTTFDNDGMPAAKIELIVSKIDSVNTLEKDIEDFKKRFQGGQGLMPDEKINIGGVEVHKINYAFDLLDGAFHGTALFGSKDGMLSTKLYIESFGGTWDKYDKSFTEIINSLRLAEARVAKTDTVFEEVEQDPPTEDMRTVSGDGWSMGIPSNFSKERGYYMGLRRGDCYLKVDVKPVKENTNLSKSVEATRSKIGGSAARKIKIGGADAMVFTYKPSGSVSGEMYFLLKNNKLYQITINWFNGEAADYKPIFQKNVRTFKFN